VEHEELTARGFGILLKTMRGVAIMVLRKDSVLIFCAMMIPCMECNGMEKDRRTCRHYCRTMDFFRKVRNQVERIRGSYVMLCYAVTMGSDFQFEHAFVNSKSLDLHVLIDPINSMEGIK